MQGGESKERRELMLLFSFLDPRYSILVFDTRHSNPDTLSSRLTTRASRSRGETANEIPDIRVQ